MAQESAFELRARSDLLKSPCLGSQAWVGGSL